MALLSQLGNAATGSGSVVLANAPVIVNPTITGAVPNVATIAGDGAITIASGTVFLSKGSAAAITLAAPASQDGIKIAVINISGFAHVITFPATTLFDGTTGAKTTATFAAFKGSAITLVASGTSWMVESKNVVTVG